MYLHLVNLVTNKGYVVSIIRLQRSAIPKLVGSFTAPAATHLTSCASGIGGDLSVAGLTRAHQARASGTCHSQTLAYTVNCGPLVVGPRQIIALYSERASDISLAIDSVAKGFVRQPASDRATTRAFVPCLAD